MPYPLTQFVKEHNNGVLASVVLEYQSGMAWGRDAEEQVNASFVSSNWFDEIGYGAAHGRVLSDALDTRAGAPVVVLSFTFWRNRLGADPNVVGSIVYIDRKPVTIAGVAAAALPGLDFNVPDMFLPITQREYFYPQSTLLRSWSDEAVDMYARLAPRCVRRRCARSAADDHAGSVGRARRGQERRVARAAAGHSQLHARRASVRPCSPSSPCSAR